MNYRKQLRKILTAKADNSGMVACALIGGLAAGAVLAVLFAPKRGSELPSDITHSGRKFGGSLWELMNRLKEKFGDGPDSEQDGGENREGKTNVSPSVKKPKSDIRSLIHEAHSS
jgi:gas vesicle protein